MLAISKFDVSFQDIFVDELIQYPVLVWFIIDTCSLLVSNPSFVNLNYEKSRWDPWQGKEWSRVGARVVTKTFQGFGEAFILGRELVSTIHYTRPWFSIKQPNPNYFATQHHVNWPVINPKSSYKIMDPVLAALPQNLRKSLLQLWQEHMAMYGFHSRASESECPKVVSVQATCHVTGSDLTFEHWLLCSGHIQAGKIIDYMKHDRY